jgi:cell division septation protein DedD
VAASEPESERTAAEAPATASMESTEVRPASALDRPLPAVKPAGLAAPDDAAESTTPAPAQGTQVAAIEDRFRVQLAAVREETDARRAWDLFTEDLGPILSDDVQPFFERAETGNGVFYRLQIGPFATQQAADSLCAELKQRNASCFVIRR